MKFDPTKHKIVTVVTDPDDPERGNHFHLSLPDLVQEVQVIEKEADAGVLNELAARISEIESKPESQALVPVEAHPVPVEVDRKIEFMTRQVATLREQVAALSDRVENQQMTPQDANEMTKAINTRVRGIIDDQITAALSDLNLRIDRVERSNAPQLADQVEIVSKMVAETGHLIKSLASQGEDLHAKYETIAGDIKRARHEFGERMYQLAESVKDMMQDGAA